LKSFGSPRSIYHLRAQSLAAPLAEILSHGQGSGTLHSVFRHSINWLTDSGVLATVVLAGHGNAPFAIVITDSSAFDFNECTVRTPMRVAANATSLSIPSAGLRIALDDAARYNPHRTVVATGHLAMHLERNGKELAHLLQRRAGDEGFGPLAQVCGTLDRVDESKNPFCRRALEAIPLFLQGVVGGDEALVTQGAGGLIGLGPGLTPSGDDCLVGALGWLMMTAGARRNWIERVGELVRLGALNKTTLVSYTYLDAVSRGMVGEYLGDVIEALVNRGSEEVRKAAERVASLGSTSGCDMLLGVYRALMLTIEQ
jgi:hypothetical protein